jgi:hypothetical protein
MKIFTPLNWKRIGQINVPLVLFIGLIVFSGCHRNRETAYRVILPNQYVGWVRVDFGGTVPPEIDSKNAITIKVDEDGTAFSDGVPIITTRYEFFYQTPNGLRTVREDFVEQGVNAGGVSSGSQNPHVSGCWYFFVGPKSYREQHPIHDFVTHASPLPTPGRLAEPLAPPK